MSDTGDRAERALREAFARRASEPAFAPLDPADLARAASGRGDDGRPVTRRGTPAWLAAAAAVVVLAVPVGVWLGARTPPGQDAAMSGPASAESGRAGGTAPDAGGSGPAETGVAGPADTAGVASAGEGVRTARLGDVAVEVPASWGTADAPADGWCAEPGWGPPEGPFVDAATGEREAAGCVDVPDADRRPHVTARPGDIPGDAVESTRADAGWVGLSREVGDAVVTVWVPAAEEPLGRQILASAREA